MNSFIQHLIVWAPQILVISFAVFSVKEEVAFTWPFRNTTFNLDPDKDLEKKKELLKTAHRSGWSAVFEMCICFGMIASWVHIGRSMIFSGFVCGLGTFMMYSLVFDIGYAKGIKKPWWYLGEFAESDVWWIKHFGAQGGKIKAYIFAAGILLLNALYLVFYYRII